jgi:hypothetical protein
MMIIMMLLMFGGRPNFCLFIQSMKLVLLQFKTLPDASIEKLSSISASQTRLICRLGRLSGATLRCAATTLQVDKLTWFGPPKLYDLLNAKHQSILINRTQVIS